MRKTLLLTMVLLAVSAWSFAQQQGANSQSAPSSTPQASEEPSPSSDNVEGCLGGSGDNFTVTDKAGKTYQLQLPPRADVSKLKEHIGHEVRVRGTMENAVGSSPSAGSSPAGQPSIAVTGMDKIADTCNGKTPGATPKSQ